MLKLLTVFVCFFLFLAGPCYARYSGGSGEPNNPYLIATPNDLNSIGLYPGDWNKHFKMISDIDMSGITGDQFNMIGYYEVFSPNDIPFSGVFDGNGHSISNFTYESNDVHYIGLFRFVDDPNALIKDLHLQDPNVNAGSGPAAGCVVGSMIGYLEQGTVTGCRVEGCRVRGAEPIGGMVAKSGGMIKDCFAEGEVIGTYASDDVGVLLGLNWYGDVAYCGSDGYAEGEWDIGGLVGNLSYGSMTDCYSTASVEGEGAVGGLVGHNYYSVIAKSWSTGDVNGNYGLGGLVGENPYGTIIKSYCRTNVSGIGQCGGLAGKSSRSTITECYAKGNVTATEDYVGGLVGWCYDTTVNHCYTALTISGTSDLGGLIGYDNSCSYAKCFWDEELAVGVDGIGNASDPNVIGESTTNMKKKSTFANAGWDFVEVWNIGENQTYPYLRVYPAGDLDHSDWVDFLDFAILASHWLEGTEP